MHHDSRQVIARLHELGEAEIGTVEIGSAQETPAALDDWRICDSSQGRREDSKIWNDANSKDFRDQRVRIGYFGTRNRGDGVRCVCCFELFEAKGIKEGED
jgi:hypothetical protein